MATLDLDKRRAERDAKPHTVTLDEQEWEFPNPMPLVVAQDLAAGDFRGVIRGLFAHSATSTRAKNAIVERIAPLLTDPDLEAIAREVYDMGKKDKKDKAPDADE